MKSTDGKYAVQMDRSGEGGDSEVGDDDFELGIGALNHEQKVGLGKEAWEALELGGPEGGCYSGQHAPEADEDLLGAVVLENETASGARRLVGGNEELREVSEAERKKVNSFFAFPSPDSIGSGPSAGAAARSGKKSKYRSVFAEFTVAFCNTFPEPSETNLDEVTKTLLGLGEKAWLSTPRREMIDSQAWLQKIDEDGGTAGLVRLRVGKPELDQISYILLIRKGSLEGKTGTSFVPQSLLDLKEALQQVPGILQDTIKVEPVNVGKDNNAPDPHGPPENAQPNSLEGYQVYVHEGVTWWELGKRKKPRGAGSRQVLPQSPGTAHARCASRAAALARAPSCLLSPWCLFHSQTRDIQDFDPLAGKRSPSANPSRQGILSAFVCEIPAAHMGHLVLMFCLCLLMRKRGAVDTEEERDGSGTDSGD